MSDIPDYVNYWMKGCYEKDLEWAKEHDAFYYDLIGDDRYGHYVAPKLECKDGFSMSVQASRIHYCEPRASFKWPYKCVEIGYPDPFECRLDDYSEDPDMLYGNGVYSMVPVELANQIVHDHGGLGREPYSYYDSL